MSALIPEAPAIEALPLVTLYLTDRCNSRCVTCDYWRHGRTNLTLAGLLPMLPALEALRTEVVLLSGGEPLLNPEWAAIARTLRQCGLRPWLLTAGLALAKHAPVAAELFDAITVSLDGTLPGTYAEIRGLDAFDKVCEGIRAVVVAGAPVTVRVTLQRRNFRELRRFVSLARDLGVAQVSFLAVDVGNAHAFARTAPVDGGLALAAEELPEFASLIDALEREAAEDFADGFIAQSPAKLRSIHAYFTALAGRGEFPPVRCNAPQFSAVVTADGRAQPCFFIPPAEAAGALGDLRERLNSTPMRRLRGVIAAGERPECRRCVCSMWREPGARGAGDFPARRIRPAASA